MDTSIEDTGAGEDSAMREDSAIPGDTAMMDAAACSEGAVTCVGASLQKCVGGKLAAVEECATAELCAASGMGPCKAPACAVAEKRCAGKVVEKCNAGRTAFESEATCDVACASGACLTITSVVGGEEHSCALLSNGTVRCWGDNGDGQLGNGTLDSKLVPTEVPALTKVVEIAAGGYHTCARLSDGELRCWGSNFRNQIGDGGLSAGARLYPTAVYGIATAAELAVGDGLSCARLTDGTVRCWGSYTTQNDPYSLTGVAKTPKTLAISDVTAIAIGGYHGCALKKDATVWCWWGHGRSGEHGDGAGATAIEPLKAQVSSAKQVAAGRGFTCAVLTDATVKCWGSLFATSRYGLTPIAIPGLTGVEGVRANGQTVCATLIAGGMRCWGTNEFGQVGDGTKVERLSPVAPTALATVLAGRQLALGWYHTMIFNTTSVYGVGYNNAGQLGTGKLGDYVTPERVVW